MNKDHVIDSMGGISGDLLAEAEALRRKKRRPAWIKGGALAACLGLTAIGAYLLPGLRPAEYAGAPALASTQTVQWDRESDDPPHDPVPEKTELPQIRWSIHYNEPTSVLDACRPYIKAVFTETLSGTKLAALTPAAAPACSGYASFDQDGNLLDVVLQTETTLPENPVTVSLADSWFGFEYELPEEALVSVCKDVEYRAFQYTAGDTVFLSARAVIGDVSFVFEMNAPEADLEQAKADFQNVLTCFACYEEGKPDLSVIVPEEIPELREQMYSTLSEARTEPDFGRYLPSALPAGFAESEIRRFQFGDDNVLSALWSSGMDDLSWVIAPYTQADAHRLTDLEDRENYDLSLYPIPRADSVPDELREIVDDPIFEAETLTLEAVYCRAYKTADAGDSDGWRMRFSVRYGDVLVSVSAKGVDPAWLYRQLVSLPAQ